MRARAWVWISVVAGAASACASEEGEWQRCCSVPPSPSLGMTRGTGAGMQCFCPAGWACNYVQSCWDGSVASADAVTFDPASDAGVRGEEAGMLDGASSAGDTGFVEAGPLDDAAVDALSMDDAAAGL